MPRSGPKPPVTAGDLNRQWDRIQRRVSREMNRRGVTRALANPWVAGGVALLGGLAAGYCLALRGQARPGARAGSPPATVAAGALGGLLERTIVVFGDLLAERLREASSAPSRPSRKEAV